MKDRNILVLIVKADYSVGKGDATVHLPCAFVDVANSVVVGSKLRPLKVVDFEDSAYQEALARMVAHLDEVAVEVGA